MNNLNDMFRQLTKQEKIIKDSENLLTVQSMQPLQSQRLSEVPIDDEPEYIVDGYVPANSLTLVSGMPSSGKTSIVASWVSAVTNGVSWCGNKVMQGNVLYVLLEDNVSQLARKMYDNNADMDKIFVMNQVHTNKPVLTFRSNETLKLPDNMDELINEVSAIKPVLIVVDALGRAVGSKSNKIQEEIAESLRSICINTGIGMVLINHLKSGHFRPENIESRIANSTAFHALSRISYLCVKDLSSNDRAIITIKNNLTEDLPPFVYRIRKKQDGRVILEPVTFYAYRITEESELALIEYHSEKKAKILACLSVYGDCTPIFIAQTIEEKYPTVKVYLRQLLQDGSIIQKKGYKYALPENIVVSMDVTAYETLQTETAKKEKEQSYTELRTVTGKLQLNSTIQPSSTGQLTANTVTELPENEKTVSTKNVVTPNTQRNASVTLSIRDEKESQKAIE